MDDSKIVEMYFSRDEKAIEETSAKYGRLCYYIAYNVLSSREDSEECVNDAYLHAWNSIPPTRPTSLGAYLSRITRNAAIDKYKAQRAKKRGENDEPLAFEELEGCISEADEIGEELILRECINSFLQNLTPKHRIIFVQRYFYMSKIKEIAENNQISEATVRVILLRLRQRFKAHIEKY